MNQPIGAVLTATVLAVLAGWFLISPSSFTTSPLLLAVPLVLGAAHGLVVTSLAGRIGTEAPPDLIRWVALSYGFAICSAMVGLAIPIFGSVLAMALAFVFGIVVPLVDPRLVVRSAASP